jgi:hypothetical protein
VNELGKHTYITGPPYPCIQLRFAKSKAYVKLWRDRVILASSRSDSSYGDVAEPATLRIDTTWCSAKRRSEISRHGTHDLEPGA